MVSYIFQTARFSGLVGYYSNWMPNLAFVAPVVLIKQNNLNLVLGKEQNGINSLVFGHPSYQIPFFIFVDEKEENALGLITPKSWRAPSISMGIIGYYRRQLDPVAQRYCPYLRAITNTALLVGSSLMIFVPHAGGALQNSYTQHFSVSYLTSYEILLLTTPNVSLSCFNNINLLLLSFLLLTKPLMIA